MTSPRIPISWGELFDKITILEIKLKKLKAKAALANVDNEFKQLNKIYREQFEASVEASQLKGELKEINQRLWTIEDQIRDKEKNKVFDDEFIQLARSVYVTNDERSRIKRRINEAFDSDLVEEKSYADY